MKKHSGMRPQDIVVLLKIAAIGDNPWFAKDLASGFEISHSEISESLNRSQIAGLLSEDKKELMRHALLEFFEYGLRYVFPAILGVVQRGMPTAHRHSMRPLPPTMFTYGRGRREKRRANP